MGRGLLSFEQTGSSKEQGPCAHRGRKPTRLMGPSNPIENHTIVHQRASPNPTWNQDYVGGGHLTEGAIDHQAQESIVGPNFSLAMPDKTNLGPGKTLQDLIGPNCIERRHLLKYRHRNFHGDTLYPEKRRDNKQLGGAPRKHNFRRAWSTTIPCPVCPEISRSLRTSHIMSF